MTIYRGPGGTGEARTDTDVTEVRIIADEAEGYKDAAAASAMAAASSAAAALSAETNAELAETNAETAETNAEAAQAAAEAAQAAAEAAQLAAETAQTAAELAETNAETAETNAELAEVNAEAAQAAAEAALASAQAVYDNFDDRYLGPKSSDPTLDNDGNALLTGALYFNTTVPEMRVYTGSAWVDFSAGAAVSSFNTRTGAVTLTSSDVTTALTYTPLQTETDPVYLASSWYGTTNNSSNWNTAYGWGNHASAGYAADSAVVHKTGDETIAGTKTFSSTITGSISGTASNVTGTVAVANGGTGATTAPNARTNLGLGTISTQDANSVAITGGTINGTTLGATTAATANVTTLTATADSSFTSTGAVKLSTGTTAQRPTGAAGKLRFNTTTSEFEGHNGSAWASVGGSAISNDTSTATNLYPLFAAATSGTATSVYTSNAQYLFKPSTGELSVKAPRASNGIVVNSATISSNYTIATGDNGGSFGPVSVASGVTVTVSSGSVWTVV